MHTIFHGHAVSIGVVVLVCFCVNHHGACTYTWSRDGKRLSPYPVQYTSSNGTFVCCIKSQKLNGIIERKFVLEWNGMLCSMEQDSGLMHHTHACMSYRAILFTIL